MALLKRNSMSTRHSPTIVSAACPRIAGEADVPLLLSMMEPFNALESTPWDAAAKEGALRTLLRDRQLGVAALLEGEAGILGYFVLTWGYDLEWDGRDAFLTELFLVPAVRGRGHGGGALAAVEAVESYRSRLSGLRTRRGWSGRLRTPLRARPLRWGAGKRLERLTHAPAGAQAHDRRAPQRPRAFRGWRGSASSSAPRTSPRSSRA